MPNVGTLEGLNQTRKGILNQKLEDTKFGMLISIFFLSILLVAILVLDFSIWGIGAPKLFGYDFHYLGMFENSWSMASPEPDGIMPLSIYYTRKSDNYKIGDVVSFFYDDKIDKEDGFAVKQILEDRGDCFLVHGLNEINTDDPFEVRKSNINGKLVWKHSFSPISFWKWLSMDWSLNDSEILARFKTIFSFRTVVSAFTNPYRNHVALNYAPHNVIATNSNYIIQETPDQVDIVDKNGQLLHRLDGKIHSKSEDGQVVSICNWITGYNAEYFWYDGNKQTLSTGLDCNGDPIRKDYSERRVVLKDGTIVEGNIIHLIEGSVWQISPSTKPTEESRIFPSDSVSSISFTGDGEADTNVEVIADNIEETFYGGGWKYTLTITQKMRKNGVVIRMTRSAGYTQSLGEIAWIDFDNKS